MSKKSVTIVHSELQLLNAIEAIKAKEIEYNVLIIASLTQRNKEIVNVFRKYANGVYSSIFNLRLFKSDSRLLFHINSILSYVFIYIYTFLYRFDYTIIGNYVEHLQRLLVCLTHSSDNEVILVDDGTATLFFADVREKELLNGVNPFTQPQGIMSYLIPIQSYKNLIVDHLTYFSMFDIPNVAESDIVIHNDYKGLKHLPTVESYNNYSVIILGQPLVRSGSITSDDYNNILNTVSVYKGNTPVYYYPHSDEVDFKPSNENIIILKREDPFEILLLRLPAECVILGFYTTALINAKKLRPDLDIRYVDIQKSLSLSQAMRLRVAQTYSYLNNELKELKIE